MYINIINRCRQGVARRIHPLIEAIPYNSTDFKNFERGDFVDEILKTGRIVYQKAA